MNTLSKVGPTKLAIYAKLPLIYIGIALLVPQYVFKPIMIKLVPKQPVLIARVRGFIGCFCMHIGKGSFTNSPEVTGIGTES